MREDRIYEGALPAKHQEYGKKKYFKKYQLSSNENTASNINQSKGRNSKRSYPPCQHCGRTGHPPFKCWKRLDAKCNKCNQFGHEAVIYKNKFQIREADAQVTDQDDEDQMFVATCFSTRSSSECWLIDSGCTNHMTFDRTLFKDLQSTEISKVRIGNGDYISTKGKGTIAIATNSGTKTISDVLYVPDIDQNLLSVGQLIEKGFKVTFKDQCCLIYDAAGHKILQIKMRGKSFSFFLTEEEYTAYSTNISNIEIWHKRLGHYHLQRMLKMKKNEVIRGLPVLADQIPNYHACQFGNKKRLPFLKSTWKASQKLQPIHTDVAGPQKTPSLKGSLYYIIFIDDFSRMCWIFFLKFKSEVVGVFWKFKKMVENQSRCKIQSIRSDNGKEYISIEFNLFCEEAGIEHQLTAPYTP